MKILSAEQVRQADAYTIEHEPIASIDLMERAASVFVGWFTARFHQQCQVAIFCGPGNNGGDGLAISRLLLQKDYQVATYILGAPKTSKDFVTNLKRLERTPNSDITELNHAMPNIHGKAVIVDALFGSGLSRPLDGLVGQLVAHLNQQPNTKIAVDMPTGLFADQPTEGITFNADYTFVFQTPKLSFMLPDNERAVGEWLAGDIGLSKAYFDAVPTPYHLVTAYDVQLAKRKRFSHKGSYGHALMVTGSFGKIGAGILAAKACLHSGAGLATVFTARCGYTAVQAALPEAMVMCSGEELIDTTVDTATYTAIGIGPGIGTDEATAKALHGFITASRHPMVVDADALNILSKHPDWLKLLPKESILTPHPKEFERLFGKTANGFDRLKLLQSKATELGINIVLKGANTAVALTNGEVWFNSTGNPGMATAGSGDVLTGIITGLLAQSYAPAQAAIYGVYLHGLAGDLAASDLGCEALIASDIVAHLGRAFISAHQSLL